MRFSTIPIPTQGHFPPNPQVPGTPQPAAPGSEESTLVENLTPGTVYYFALRSLDEAENLSSVSNVAQVKTTKPDTIFVPPPVDSVPPAAITDLAAVRLDVGVARLTWTATGDDGDIGRADRFSIRWSYSPITSGNWSSSQPFPNLPIPGPSGTRHEFEVRLPTDDRETYVGISAFDDAGNSTDPVNPAHIASLSPRTWNVRVDGSGDASTIQAALDQSAPGDILRVGPGLYRVTLTLPSWSVSLISESGATQTTLESAVDASPVIHGDGLLSSRWTIEGFSITRPAGSVGRGIETRTGVLILRHSIISGHHASSAAGVSIYNPDGTEVEAVEVRNCTFSENVSEKNGGAIGISSGKYDAIVISNNEFRDNSAGYDGGGVWLYFVDAPVELTGNFFARNLAFDHAGAVYVGGRGGTIAKLRENVFVSNEAAGGHPGETGSGGAICIIGTPVEIDQNTFVENKGYSESGFGGGAINLQSMSDAVKLTRNIIVGSEGGAISLFDSVMDLTLGDNLIWETSGTEFPLLTSSIPTGWDTRIIRADPQFCDRSQGDYSVASSSPARFGEDVMGAIKKPGCGPR